MSKKSKREGLWAFAAAAAAAPMTFLAAAPCGLVCGGCPLGGACLLSSPVAFGFVLAVQARGLRKGKDDPTEGLTIIDEPSDQG